jgi:hypothetical protein
MMAGVFAGALVTWGCWGGWAALGETAAIVRTASENAQESAKENA